MRVRAGAMVNCALCHNAPATVFCFNDNAQLCTGCDVQIHKTNKLTWRHQRVHLCEMCEEIRGTRWCSARKIRCVDVLTFRFEHPRALGGLAHPASRAHSGCYRGIPKGEEEFPVNLRLARRRASERAATRHFPMRPHPSIDPMRR